MHLRSVVFVAACLFGAYAQAALCNCGLGIGKDVCHPQKCVPMVVRPHKLPKIEFDCKPVVVCKEIPPLKPLQPIGDLCSCTKTIVTPAHVPKPKCLPCSCLDKIASSSAHASHHHHHAMKEYHHHHELHCAAPADPVSLSLAYNMQHKACNNINEDKLAFGFRVIPKEIPVSKKINNIHEEKLFNLNGEIVELKPVICSSGKSIDEEAAEDLLAHQLEDENCGEESTVRKLSYGEIGFGPATIAEKNFVSVNGGGAAASSSASVGVGFSNAACNDGFVPGKVQVQNIPMAEAYQPKLALPNGFDSIEEEDPDQPIPIPYPAFKYTSSSSSASCQNSKRQSIMFEKLSCS